MSDSCPRGARSALGHPRRPAPLCPGSWVTSLSPRPRRHCPFLLSSPERGHLCPRRCHSGSALSPGGHGGRPGAPRPAAQAPRSASPASTRLVILPGTRTPSPPSRPMSRPPVLTATPSACLSASPQQSPGSKFSLQGPCHPSGSQMSLCGVRTDVVATGPSATEIRGLPCPREESLAATRGCFSSNFNPLK